MRKEKAQIKTQEDQRHPPDPPQGDQRRFQTCQNFQGLVSFGFQSLRGRFLGVFWWCEFGLRVKEVFLRGMIGVKEGENVPKSLRMSRTKSWSRCWTWFIMLCTSRSCLEFAVSSSSCCSSSFRRISSSILSTSACFIAMARLSSMLSTWGKVFFGLNWGLCCFCCFGVSLKIRPWRRAMSFSKSSRARFMFILFFFVLKKMELILNLVILKFWRFIVDKVLKYKFNIVEKTSQKSWEEHFLNYPMYRKDKTKRHELGGIENCFLNIFDIFQFRLGHQRSKVLISELDEIDAVGFVQSAVDNERNG